MTCTLAIETIFLATGRMAVTTTLTETAGVGTPGGSSAIPGSRVMISGARARLLEAFPATLGGIQGTLGNRGNLGNLNISVLLEIPASEPPHRKSRDKPPRQDKNPLRRLHLLRLTQVLSRRSREALGYSKLPIVFVNLVATTLGSSKRTKKPWTEIKLTLRLPKNMPLEEWE